MGICREVVEEDGGTHCGQTTKGNNHFCPYHKNIKANALVKKKQKEGQAKKKKEASEKRKKKASEKKRKQDDQKEVSWSEGDEVEPEKEMKKKTSIKKKKQDLIDQDTTSEEFSLQVKNTVARVTSDLKKVRDSILEETKIYKTLQYHDFVDECDDKMLLVILDHLSKMHSNVLRLEHLVVGAPRIHFRDPF
jgi:hypothetical protein